MEYLLESLAIFLGFLCGIVWWQAARTAWRSIVNGASVTMIVRLPGVISQGFATRIANALRGHNLG